MIKNYVFYSIALLAVSLSLFFSAIRSNANDSNEEKFRKNRMGMVKEQIERRGVRDKKVLQAMETIPRHHYVPKTLIDSAYNDGPLPIGEGQTISQPYIVAYMAEALKLAGTETVLEIGTGSAYNAAILSLLAKKVYSIEIVKPLGLKAIETLKKEGIKNVSVRVGDGYKGWPDEAPFDAIILTASPPKIPQPLIDQLKEGGILLAPVGKYYQKLVRLTKVNGKIKSEDLIPVRFVPMTGKAQE